MTVVHKLMIPLLIVTSLFHAAELGIFRPMPDWIAYFGLFGSQIPNIVIAILLALGSILITVGRYVPQWKNRELSITGKQFIAAGFGLDAVGRFGWILWDTVGEVPQPPSNLGISTVTLLMYATLYAAFAVICFCMARRRGCENDS